MDSMDVSTSTVSAEEVISKLKDEGDFDRLRLKIISKLKENEELRNNIILAVKESSVLNREGAENLKPRQLSDAIHEEIGKKVMGQISDSLWEVIRSSDGMRSEISETVESVYNRLLNPKGKEVNESSPLVNPTPNDMEASSKNSQALPAHESEMVSHSEPTEPPGFSTCNRQEPMSSQEDQKEEAEALTSQDRKHADEKEIHDQHHFSPSSNDPGVPPGFAPFPECQQTYHGNDEDPDVPPGFG